MDSVLKSLSQADWHQRVVEGVDPAVIDDLSEFLSAAEQAGNTIFPNKAHWFRALNALSPEQVRVVILGQDPYHGPGQAQGFSFSVPEGMKLPPSLRNIFKEIHQDVSIENQSGDLTFWAEQGVLLLNAVLTVEAGKAGSHAGQGWEQITDTVIKSISEQQNHVVFMLWGGYAEKKKKLIDNGRHLVLTAAHPSPLSAYRGWFGCQHFSLANAYLQQNGLAPIDWRTGHTEQLALI